MLDDLMVPYIVWNWWELYFLRPPSLESSKASVRPRVNRVSAYLGIAVLLYSNTFPKLIW